MRRKASDKSEFYLSNYILFIKPKFYNYLYSKSVGQIQIAVEGKPERFQHRNL